MKANDAPEKIYIDDFGTELGHDWHIEHSYENDIEYIRTIIKRFFCKHSYEFVRNVYGDEIRYLGWKRSIWKCTKCGKIQYSNELNE